ncbi:MAG TPA: tRNA dihydrouridine synthase DusB [Gemmataceae bacterium]|nr:tRNA dihydrouridine synthase DusB [Gemmataceae bacterium]
MGSLPPAIEFVPASAAVRPLMLRDVRLPSRYMLSPLAGYTNLPFRQAVRELGGLGLGTTDLVNARALILANHKTMDLIATSPDDRPMAVQIYGADAGELTRAAQWLENYGVTSIDINMGCPVPKVTKGGGGSAMMCDLDGTTRTIAAVVDSVKVPVTVKMRLGWDETSLSAPRFAREFEQVGVAAVFIHGRTRAQGFSGTVDLDGIRQVVEAVDKMPVIGNGDVKTIADAERMFQVTGCAGISIGRGALLNPWIFRQLCRWETTGDPGPPATYDDRLDFMSRHYGYLVEQRGGRFASLTFRKFAGWYCKVLKPGHALQQRLVMLADPEEFAELVDLMRAAGPPPFWQAQRLPEIAVPKGPISHW